ncbi:enoyl-CoA hydratase [Paraburkholderia caballeronis]|uniref:Enoyl-CoA hydratase/carnithine racemase n=1 Tax=Paraburkholderia caballeronis TaxID=416943 RepID=A0A1H7PXA8_9BURK|nr:enoyl-CoA hydratase [Paraburkholderia caballeronis]PXW24386.1 enoyl-CoA hydratase [Paraburkholderia caballeronis]PXX00168.1 enoyl-CoA hydratase [Paraburkholderia caballeronis]RAJ97297.1 enoyl-CoA hydratase [Paraburkholderia caballeronis]TDV09871.1 enoyl-CoA hydratase [Paraburkholderia caballeronis]TDV14116.1 enoyl-CoA hydratase [Paraburkholderia caballeronis]
MSNDIQVARADGVLTITIDRPARRNALTPAMYQTMVDALNAAHDDATVRAILFRGHADIFTAGNDIEDFLKSPPAGDESPVFRFLLAISSAGKPLVAAVAGAAIGVGTTMLLHCDLVYAADTARFAMPFAQLGLCPEAASSLLLPRIAGYQAAAEKLLLGDMFDAAEAHRMGFVNRVLPAAELDAFVAAQLAKLTALPAASLRATKTLMKRAGEHEIRTQMAEESVHFGKMLLAPEAREAFSAFLEKRKPDFRQFD